MCAGGHASVRQLNEHLEITIVRMSAANKGCSPDTAEPCKGETCMSGHFRYSCHASNAACSLASPKVKYDKPATLLPTPRICLHCPTFL